MDPPLIVLDAGADIRSARLAGLLNGCKEALFIGSTSGSAVMDAILGDTEGGDMTRGVVIDAVASEMTDAALDWIMGFFNRLLAREPEGTLVTCDFIANIPIVFCYCHTS